MDADRFEALSKTLASTSGRRAALRTLAVSVLGGGLAAREGFGDMDAATKGKHHQRRGQAQGKKKPCPPCKKRQKGKCKQRLPDGTTCPGGTCQGGACLPSTESTCTPNCIDRTCGNDGCGGSCGTCAANQTCQGGNCTVLACGAGGPCTVFVTSTTYTGLLGGLAGADDKCRQRALVAGLPGTYMAWLSDEFLTPADRFTQSTGPYQLVTGAIVANNWGDLTDGSLAAAIRVTETGVMVAAGDMAWTNTMPDGTHVTTVPRDCDNWTTLTLPIQGRFGFPAATNGNFTSGAIGDCNVPHRLYCFQQG